MLYVLTCQELVVGLVFGYFFSDVIFSVIVNLCILFFFFWFVLLFGVCSGGVMDGV